MINLEHKLTVDDLIVEYMLYKVNNGYEPQFLTSEFISFLDFFESKMPVQDSLYDGEKLFQRFFEREAESDDWLEWTTNEEKFIPHMDMIYSKEDNDYIIKANYNLNSHDKSCINTYYMDNGMSQFDYYKGTAAKIRRIIGEYLVSQPKRKIDENIKVEDNNLIIGKYVTAEIIKNIWDSYINKLIKNHKWPEQCKDINKYLFEMDLASLINLKSIKKELLDFYEVISKRIAILYQQDKNLKISNCISGHLSNGYLAKANYDLLINGYQEIFEIAFGKDKSALNIDLELLTFKESHENGGVYAWDEDVDVNATNSKIGNDNIKKLVRTIDKNI